MFNPRRFTLNLIVYSVGLWLIQSVLQVFFNLDPTERYLSILSTALAAMQEGHKYALHTGKQPAKEDTWRISRVMAEIYLTLTVILSVFASILSADVRTMFATIDLFALLLVFAIFTGMALVFIRWGYSWGIKLGLQEYNKNTG